MIGMELRHYSKDDSHAIIQLFASVFADSEGQTEGTLIGQLAKNLFETTREGDLFNFVAADNGRIIGSIFFSRLDFGNDNGAFILAPVAVHSDHQGKGIGQALINHGLNAMKKRGVSVVLTYGNPGFYHKVGFHQISPETVKPPFELSQPQGWLGQSLVGHSIDTLSGSCECVEALSDPAYW